MCATWRIRSESYDLAVFASKTHRTWRLALDDGRGAAVGLVLTGMCTVDARAGRRRDEARAAEHLGWAVTRCVAHLPAALRCCVMVASICEAVRDADELPTMFLSYDLYAPPPPPEN